MGVRTAATKLGFRLAAATSNKKFSSNSLFSRRSITSSATSTMVLEKKEKSSELFLCFDERKQSDNKLDTNIVLRPIRLDSYSGQKEEELLERSTNRFPFYKDVINPESDSDSDGYRYNDSDSDSDEEEEKLRRETACQTRITCLGSKILFTVGQTTPKDICSVDPLTRPAEFNVSSETETKIKSFSTPKLDMRWGVIDGKLYCFENCPLSQSFEVLDPKIDQSSWQPLSGPPFIREDGGTDKYNVLFLNESRKILGWENARNGVYCFDATTPENEWIESARGFGDAISLMGQNDNRLVIHDNHPKLGDFNLMFSYDRCEEPFLISPFFISDNCDSFRSINEPIRLPKLLCSKYRIDYCQKRKYRRRTHPRETFDSQLVHLGSQKFCLILHKFDERDSSDDCRIKGKILVATFEYDVTVTSNNTNDSKNPLEIKTHMLGTRRFRYYLKHQSAGQSDMIGAFSF